MSTHNSIDRQEELWNEQVSAESYHSAEQYNKHIFLQYRLYVQMADKVSERRAHANAFFLTLNTLLLGIAAFLYEKGPRVSEAYLNIFPLLAALLLCIVWWFLLHSYRQLNTGKFQVIGEFEARLPAKPFVDAEWNALGKGEDWRKYLPLTTVEKAVPIAFSVIYILMATAIWWQSANP